MMTEFAAVNYPFKTLKGFLLFFCHSRMNPCVTLRPEMTHSVNQCLKHDLCSQRVVEELFYILHNKFFLKRLFIHKNIHLIRALLKCRVKMHPCLGHGFKKNLISKRWGLCIFDPNMDQPSIF